jgi:hypothetical protein
MGNSKTVVPGRLTFRPVPLNEDGQCKGEHLHFKGVAREVYSYLKLLAANHGGFVFASVENIAQHTKDWKRKKQHSERQVKRILKMFREFKVLGPRQTRQLNGRTYQGWPVVEHVFWAENQGHICEFKHWLEYEDSFQQSKQQNVTALVT